MAFKQMAEERIKLSKNHLICHYWIKSSSYGTVSTSKEHYSRYFFGLPIRYRYHGHYKSAKDNAVDDNPMFSAYTSRKKVEQCDECCSC